jgi:ribonuclease J
MAYVSHAHPDIPVLSSKPTFAVMRTLQEAGAGSDKDFVTFKEYYKKPKEKLVMERDYRFIEDGPLELGDLVFHGYPVDHSLPGAAGYIIETPKGTVVYTGDLRFHGSNKKLTEDFVKAAAKAKPLVLITEGTNINEKPDMSEAQVYRHISKAMKQTKGLVVANFPKRDVDRLNSFLKAAKANGRKLAIDINQAYLLKCMFEAGCAHVSPAINPKSKDPHMRDLFTDDVVVFAKQKKEGRILRDAPLEEVVKDYFGWEREFIASNYGTPKKPAYVEQEFVRNAHQIRNNQDKYVVFVDNFAVQNLIDLQPKKGSKYIYSKTEPFDAEMEIDYDRLENWVDRYFGLDNLVHAHASGHAFGSQVINMIKMINPEVVIPIHTEHPEMFAEMLKKADRRFKMKEAYQGEVIIPELSTTYTLNQIEL